MWAVSVYMQYTRDAHIEVIEAQVENRREWEEVLRDLRETIKPGWRIHSWRARMVVPEPRELKPSCVTMCRVD